MTPYRHHFHGDLAGFADALRTGPPHPAADLLNATQLADPEGIAPLLERFGAAHGCSEHRARASLWSKYFFSRLGIATLVTQLATGRALDLRLSRLQIAPRDDGSPHFFLLADACGAAPAAEGEDFSALIDTTFAPVVAALSAHCRLSTRVFWSNAGVYFDWALGELERQQRIPAKRLTAVRALMASRQRPDGGFNPFHRIHKRCPPGTLDGNGEPVEQCRRLCCMRDLDSRWDLCSNCPRAMHSAEPDRATG